MADMGVVHSVGIRYVRLEMTILVEVKVDSIAGCESFVAPHLPPVFACGIAWIAGGKYMVAVAKVGCRCLKYHIRKLQTQHT